MRGWASLLHQVTWGDIERWLRDPGDILDDLDGQMERAAADALIEAESITLARAIEGLGAQRRQVLQLNIRGCLGDGELDAELDRIAAEKSELEARVAALEPPSGEELSEVPQDLLAVVGARLDAGLSIEQRQEIVRLLARVVIHTTTGADGRKSVRAAVTYRFPGVVQTDTDTGSSPRRGAGSARCRSGSRPFTITSSGPALSLSDRSAMFKMDYDYIAQIGQQTLSVFGEGI